MADSVAWLGCEKFAAGDGFSSRVLVVPDRLRLRFVLSGNRIFARAPDGFGDVVKDSPRPVPRFQVEKAIDEASREADSVELSSGPSSVVSPKRVESVSPKPTRKRRPRKKAVN